MRDYEELVTEVGLIAQDHGLLDPAQHDVSLDSNNEPDFSLAMWLEYLNLGKVRISDALGDEIIGWNTPAEFDDERDIIQLLAENRALPA